jgi:ABC-2 type transport system permease protein
VTFWIVNGLVVPRVMADLSERLHPTPSATRLRQETRDDFAEGIEGNNPADARRKELEKKTLAQYGVACPST